MSKQLSETSNHFGILNEAIESGEVAMVQHAVEIFQVLGFTVDVSQFVDDFMKDSEYVWNEKVGFYELKDGDKVIEKREVKKNRTIIAFFKNVDKRRTREQFWAVVPDHELYYLVYTFNYFVSKRKYLDPTNYLDLIAANCGYKWVEEKQKYVR